MHPSYITSGAGTPSNTSARDRLSELVQRMASWEHTDEMSVDIKMCIMNTMQRRVWTMTLLGIHNYVIYL